MDKKGTLAERYKIGDLILDLGTFQVSRESEVIELSRLSFRLLLALVRASPNVLGHDDLVEQVWASHFVSNETVTQRIKLLRQALDDSATEPRYIGLVRGEGYRMLAEVGRLPAVELSSSVPPGVGGRKKLRYALAFLSLVLAALMVVYLWTSQQQSGDPDAIDFSAQSSIAILPFINASKNPADTYISEGLGDELRDQLGRIAGLRVAARSSSVAFRESAADAVAISNRLGVEKLIEGIFRHAGDDLEVTLQIINGATGLQVWMQTYSFDIRDVLAAQQQMADELAQQLLPMKEQEEVTSVPVTRNLSAHDLILLARHYEQQVRNQPIVDQALLLKAIDMYRLAINVDPTSALAQCRLGGALLYLGDVEAAKGPIFESLKLDSDLSDVQYTLGLYYWKRGQPGSGAAYERAIQLNPNNADALSAYAMWRWHQAEADTPEPYFLRALALDPMLPSRYLDLGNYYGNAGRSEEALHVIDELRTRFDDNQTALMQARIYELTGDYESAIFWALRARELQPDNPEPRWMVAELYARIGDFQHANEFESSPGPGQLYWQRRYDDLIELAEDLLFEQPGDIKTAYVLARAYNAKGRFRQAVVLLERAGLPDTVYSDSRRADGVESMTVLADAYDALGEAEKAKEYSDWLITFFQKMSDSGFQKSWWPHLYQACALSIARRADEALEQLVLSTRSPGLPWYPFLRDSHCFMRLADNPAYGAIIEDMDQRMAGLRRDLPDKLTALDAVRTNVKPQP